MCQPIWRLKFGRWPYRALDIAQLPTSCHGVIALASAHCAYLASCSKRLPKSCHVAIWRTLKLGAIVWVEDNQVDHTVHLQYVLPRAVSLRKLEGSPAVGRPMHSNACGNE
eukprot:364930-Chlamydomonas_euryale.AAC.23